MCGKGLVPGGNTLALMWTLCRDAADAELSDVVTDSGLSALASAGCGARLTSLRLWGECDCVRFLFRGRCGDNASE